MQFTYKETTPQAAVLISGLNQLNFSREFWEVFGVDHGTSAVLDNAATNVHMNYETIEIALIDMVLDRYYAGNKAPIKSIELHWSCEPKDLEVMLTIWVFKEGGGSEHGTFQITYIDGGAYGDILYNGKSQWSFTSVDTPKNTILPNIVEVAGDSVQFTMMQPDFVYRANQDTAETELYVTYTGKPEEFIDKARSDEGLPEFVTYYMPPVPAIDRPAYKLDRDTLVTINYKFSGKLRVQALVAEVKGSGRQSEPEYILDGRDVTLRHTETFRGKDGKLTLTLLSE
ncbi:hypothetical protein [Vibrio phage vB_pir03]|nr:hypothetical protein [Vibrio phage vB_pir03]